MNIKETVSGIHDIDKEIDVLVSVLNCQTGFKTDSSCFGHHKNPVRIWLTVDSIENLNNFLFYRFNGNRSWRLVVDNADPHRCEKNIRLMLESTSFGDDVYGCIDQLIKDMQYESYIPKGGLD